MIKQMVSKRNLILLLIAIGVPTVLIIGQLLLINYTALFPEADAWQLAPLFYVAAIFEFLVGFILGDVYVARYRHQSKNWAGTLPPEQKKGIWSRRFALWLGALLLFVTGFILDMIASFG